MCIFIGFGSFHFQVQILDKGDDTRFRLCVSWILLKRYWDFDIHWSRQGAYTNFDFGRDISHYYESKKK